MEKTDQFSTLCPHFFVENKLFIEWRLRVTLWVAFDISNGYLNPNSGSYRILHLFFIFLSPLQIHINFMVDSVVLAFFNSNEGNLSSLHYPEACLDILE